MDDGFDGELYLRMAVERAVLNSGYQEGGRGPWNDAVLETASALLAVDAIGVELAEEIVDDYDVAILLRGRSTGRPPRRFSTLPPAAAGSPVTITAARVVACNAEYEQAWGRLRVHYVELSDHATTVAVTATESSPGALMSALGPQGPNVTLSDDQGRSETASFSGGGMGGGYSGRLVTSAPLSPSTRWIDLPDARIDLDRGSGPSQVDVRVEPVPIVDPAEHYLWQRLTMFRHGPFLGQTRPVETSIDALVAAGAIRADNPALAGMRAVAGGQIGAAGVAVGALPASWASLMSSLGSAGASVRTMAMMQSSPATAVAIGVVAPAIDGITISFQALLVSDAGFSVDVFASPGLEVGPFQSSLRGSTLAWWSADDRGNYYLGSIGSGGAGIGGTTATVGYFPAIDRRASELRIIPTGSAEQAVVTIPLPEWPSS